jgi:competence protein ComEA
MSFPTYPLAVLLTALASVAVAGPVNINSADATTIARELKGIGLTKAQAIVEYRQKHGPFRSADELASVRGIGQSTIEANRSDIRTDRAAARPAAAGAPAMGTATSRQAKPGGR